jgi:outer membrane protein OmpA-like peptidoglycan-associated protein
MSRYALPPALPHALAIGLVCATALTGCLTKPVKPAPSEAILQTRAREGAKPAACAVEDLASISPMEVGFGFGETQLGEAAQQRVAKAAAWLKCNPGVEVVVLPAADNHGTPARQQELAQARAKAVVDQLRALGATQAVIRAVAAGAPDPVTAPHFVIQARGRGW